MELDDFKTLYQARFAQLPGKSDNDLTALLQKRSRTAVERIQYHLLWEIGIAIALALVLAVVLLTGTSTTLRWLGGFGLLICLVQVVSFGFQYRQLSRRLQPPAGSVKAHLTEIADLVRRFAGLYYRYTLISLPISFVFGGLIGATADDTDPAVSLVPAHMSLWQLGLLLLAAAGLMLGMVYFLKWYIHRLYGRYLTELERCLDELNEVPER
ncbi:hypothetical protein GCM10023187_26020 [Nibrella viscosa]|uniref:Uncharacterized protein n=1 Tax=Nibrella viscosa TaxID=1084524 RepID=A0ABP8KH13_9BACT